MEAMISREMIFIIGFDEAKKRILDNRPNTRIVESIEYDDIYAFALMDNSADENDYVICGYDVIDKVTGRIYAMSSVQIVFREGGKKIDFNKE
ncbi:MAG: hypothetical protein IJ446_04525 [Oscillospiraceae bacterium]|nr:hypothetical protein [Oscillospiraceae bacterium]